MGSLRKFNKILESVKWGAILSVCMCVQSLIVERRSLSFGVCFGSHTLCALLRGNCRNGHHRFLWLLLLLWLCTKPFVYMNLWTLIIFMYDWTVYSDFGRFCCAWLPPRLGKYNIVYIIITLWVPFLYVVDIVLRYFKAATVLARTCCISKRRCENWNVLFL